MSGRRTGGFNTYAVTELLSDTGTVGTVYLKTLAYLLFEGELRLKSGTSLTI